MSTSNLIMSNWLEVQAGPRKEPSNEESRCRRNVANWVLFFGRNRLPTGRNPHTARIQVLSKFSLGSLNAYLRMSPLKFSQTVRPQRSQQRVTLWLNWSKISKVSSTNQDFPRSVASDHFHVVLFPWFMRIKTKIKIWWNRDNTRIRPWTISKHETDIVFPAQGMLRIHVRAQLDGALGWVTLSSGRGNSAVWRVVVWLKPKNDLKDK